MAEYSLPPSADAASAFEAIRHEDERGEYRLARELATALGYSGAGA